MAQYRIPKARGMRTRERAPKYEELPPYEPIQIPPVYHVTVAERGRVVLPAELRDKLNIRDGDRLSLTLEDDGVVTLQTRDVAIRRMRGMFKHLRKPGDPLASDQLMAERRREARLEDRRFREWKALHRRMKRR